MKMRSWQQYSNGPFYIEFILEDRRKDTERERKIARLKAELKQAKQDRGEE